MKLSHQKALFFPFLAFKKQHSVEITKSKTPLKLGFRLIFQLSPEAYSYNQTPFTAYIFRKTIQPASEFRYPYYNGNK